MAAALGATMFAGCGSNEETPAEESSTKSEAPAEDSSEASTDETSEASTDETSEGSGETAATSYDNEGKKVSALFFSLEGEYFTMLDDMLKQGLEERGYTYESQSCNFDPVTQIEQIENATAGGATCIWIWAQDGKQVADACAKAREQGVLIYSFVQDPSGNADVVRGTDEVTCGTAIAEMAQNWADETYGEDAEANSIKTVILGDESSENQKTRTDTIQKVLEEDGRFEIVDRVLAEGSTVECQTATENIYAKHGDTIDCIVTVGGEYALGVLAYLDSETSVVADPVSLGVFGAEMSEDLAAYMRDGLYDGSALNGGNIIDNIAVQVDEIDKLVNGDLESGTFSAVDIGQVTVDNLEEYGY